MRLSRLVISTLLCLSALPLSAQFTSAIEGTITDPTGAAVPGATVTLRNVETGITTTSTTSSAGYYRFASLQSNVFKLTGTATGFKTTEIPDFRIQVGETKTLNFALELGAQATVVAVTDRPPLIEASEGRVSAVIEGQKLAELPLVGRNFYSLVVLTPGVTGLPSGGTQAYAAANVDVFITEYGVNMNAGGLRSEQNRFSLDSSNVTSMVRGGVVNITPNAESIQELRVSVNNFSAENGAGAGASVSAISKSGSNDLHGSASLFHTNNKLSSRQMFSNGVPVYRRNEGVGSLGGPIFRNKTFFFVSLDRLISSVATSNLQRNVTPEFLSLVQSLRPNSIGTSLLKQFTSGVVPVQNYQTAGSIGAINANGTSTPVTCANLATGPTTPIQTVIGMIPCNMNVTGEGSFNVSPKRTGLQWNARLDHAFTDKDRFFGSVYKNGFIQGGNQVRQAFRATSDQYTESLMLNWTHTISPTMLNEASGSAVRAFGNNECLECQVPSITVTNLAGFGVGGPTIFAQNNYEFRDTLSWNTGGHSFKTGINIMKLQSNFNPTLGYQRSNYSFLNVFDFANDDANQQGNIGFNPITGSPNVPNVAERQQVATAFVQDNWKVKSNLTVTMGLRWETFGRVKEPTGLTNVEFRGGNDFTSRIADGKNALVDVIYKNPDYNNFGPRFSLAWDPTKKGRTSVRAGAGMFYDPAASQLYGGSHFNPPIWAIATAAKNTPPFLPLFGLGKSATDPYQFPRPTSITTGLDERNGLKSGLVNITWVDPSMRNSYVYDWFFGLQQSFGQDWVVEGNYVGSVGHKLYAKFNVNRVNGDLLTDATLNRLNPSFGNIDYAMSPFNSAYQGANFSVKRRFSRGLALDAAYTLGKAIDYMSGFTTGLPTDVQNWRGRRGLADFHVGQKLSLSLTYQAPELKAMNAAVRGVAGGWQLGWVTILQSGGPYTVNCTTAAQVTRDATGRAISNAGCDFNLDGTNSDSPNAPITALNLSGLERSAFQRGVFTIADFPKPALGQQGDLGRNTYIGPGYANTDLSLMKNFKMPWFMGDAGSNLQFRAESFNIFNRVNLGQPESNMNNSANFGRATTARAARNIQFGLRFSF